jgi:magnesium transporter
MIEEKDMTAAPPLALREEDGAVREEYVERVAQAITAGDSAALRELVGDLHEADVGDLIEALDPDLRPRLVKLMGHDFDFFRADRGR